MDLSTFIWSVTASVVAAAIFGTAAYKFIQKNKTKNIDKSNNNIAQNGNENNAYQKSNITVNGNRKEDNMDV
ncbi:hypothetical protein [Bacillus sp. 37MA]|uniref:hypothetical protein n=1 Tax=Bacillus sp. 37MA TaxID=1132442 RepID=UPI00036D7E77|nr:hypothetical protein [Bacillus sp. 37MA]